MPPRGRPTLVVLSLVTHFLRRVILFCLVLRRRRLPFPCSLGFFRLSAQLRPPCCISHNPADGARILPPSPGWGADSSTACTCPHSTTRIAAAAGSTSPATRTSATCSPSSTTPHGGSCTSSGRRSRLLTTPKRATAPSISEGDNGRAARPAARAGSTANTSTSQCTASDTSQTPP